MVLVRFYLSVVNLNEDLKSCYNFYSEKEVFLLKLRFKISD